MFNTNQYFDGQVASIAFNGEEHLATVGVIAPGEFTFNTSQHETMTVVSGDIHVQQADESSWTQYTRGQSFEVPANSHFS
ncbi:MAG: pyrimidine/purine nucleoside phosphorylase, partial [Pseudomonadota bacterium]